MSDTNERLRVQLDQLLGQYDTVRRALADTHAKMRAVCGKAESPDRLIEATVGGRGTLTALRLDPTVYRKMAPSQLGEAIVTTVEHATAAAHAQLSAMLTPVLPTGAPVEQLVRGEAPPASWVGAQAVTGTSLDEWWTRTRGAGQ